MRVLVWLALVAATGTARAQVATDDFGIERFRIGMDRAALLDVDWAGVPDHGSWSASAWVGLAHDPLVIYRDDAKVEALVDRRVTTGLVGSIALWKRVELGIGVDLVGYQRGSETLMELPMGGLGDARAIIKVLAYGTEAFQLAVVPTVTVPGGSARGYLRESGSTFAPALAASYTHGRLRTACNAGYRFRKRTDTAGLLIDDEMFARVAVGIELGSMTELATSFSIASPPRDRDRNQIAIEAMAGAARRVSATADIFAAGGVGLDNGFGTPDWRAVLGVRFARATRQATIVKPPVVAVADGDADRDGVPDKVDRCVNAAEDKDGFQDEDGCPDPSGRIEGRVVDLEGLPIANGKVRIVHADPAVAPIEVTTNSDGRFGAPIEGGAVEITVAVAEYQPGTAKTQVTGGASASVEIKLARKVRQGQLRGQVLSFGGKPLTATITVHAAGKQIATTTADADGNFTVELPEGTFEVVIDAIGHVTQKRTIKVKLDGVTVLNLDMRGVK